MHIAFLSLLSCFLALNIDFAIDSICIYKIKVIFVSIGLFSDALVNKFGARTCVFMSGLIAGIGLIICSIASSPLTFLPGLIFCGKFLVYYVFIISFIIIHSFLSEFRQDSNGY